MAAEQLIRIGIEYRGGTLFLGWRRRREDGLGDTAIPGYSPASFFTDIGRLVETFVRSYSSPINYGYRKLRFFSGNLPVPSGEEAFETWIDQATQALGEWEAPDPIKRQRIVESLRAPASDIIRNLKRDKPDCTAAEYLEALREISGCVKSSEELKYLFEHTYQKEGEKLSTFVTCLDKILHQVILKDGLTPETASQMLLRQILRGALPLDPILLKLRVRGQDEPLTYSRLMKTIREEEVLVAAKCQPATTLNSLNIGTSAYSALTTLNVSADDEQQQIKPPTHGPLGSTGEVSALDILMQAVTQVAKSHSTLQQAFNDSQRSVTQVIQTQEELRQSIGDIQKAVVSLAFEKTTSGAQHVNKKPLDRRQCFHCGKTGHLQAQCTEDRVTFDPLEEILSALQERLQSQKSSENSKGPR
ncbi:paraneoplastic antigen Ma2 homolog [Polypterus senegalus]|uniref:paraneoplastic antigen Ma2 homolog n=1 Tax=Polypterus senegalus TaxID=55291 RepID=UPI001962BE29|nr:paraneoplastic antigen Ma2 homolog [Polypterus senegalus]